ncbi:M14 family metallopeptidase [Pseudogemmatithrix spongiicola]|uniref:M14 family metallopeptidase n=1 Tax=Pseudogemmatithrix spongiicola TaxID=3062599 RepID=A0AA49JWJ9_9BACT|nr:M14 family metallopeptidase [Gemmatimonadaceae bacterium 'strain 138']WKW16266.1 M14 family metallopeptidase [Gemmatimonadaceae bacterium 'strain 318']
MLGAQQTRAERSAYTETSTHADVIAFIDSLERAYPTAFVRGEIGRSGQGKVLPYLLISRPLVRDAGEARRSGKPIVYVQGNIHGGEVEGKEALLALVRDLLRDARPNVLDSIVLVAVPIYNADGNDAFGPQERLRGAQNGPQLVGNRPNAQNLDLNRDYIKVEAPETAASMRMFAMFDPHVFMDLHTTNGSYHGYALTYSPSLHPAAMDPALAPAGPFTRDTLLPLIRERMRSRHRLETFDYGNFRGRDDVTSTQKAAWETYEHVPRFGTNYYGLRNRVSILSEAYSHDPFERRVLATYHYVHETLHAVAEHRATILARTGARSTLPASATVALRSQMTTTPFTAPILVEPLIPTGDSVRYEPGLRRGFRRSNVFTAVEMPVYDRFEPTLRRPLPTAWIVPVDDSAFVARLAHHGIEFRQIATSSGSLGTVTVERFVIDSIARAPRPFQGHQEVRLVGRWVTERMELRGRVMLVPASPRQALLASILLEPESDDGLTTWNFLDAALRVGAPHPVVRITGPLPRAFR